MKRGLFCIIFSLYFMIAQLPVLANAAETVTTGTQSPRAAHQTTYQAPTQATFQEARALFSRHFQGQFQPELAKRWQALGYRLSQRKQIWWIEPVEKRRAADGEYAFNPQATDNNLLQAPHRFTDYDSGRIVRRLFNSNHYIAAGWNTVNRHVVDLAHTPDSIMMALTAAWQDTIKTGKLIQIHGFSREKRQTRAGRNSELIVSTGHKKHSPMLLPIMTCLQQIWPDSHRYPDDVSELGATTNAMVLYLEPSSQRHFIHVELNRPVRQQLIQSPKTLAKLNHCLLHQPQHNMTGARS